MEKSNTPSVSKLENASNLIRYHSIGAAAIGLVPIPLLDMALLVGVQVNLVRSLANVYEMPFSDEVGKSVISALLGMSVPAFAWSAMRFVPGIGFIGGSVLSAATTYAVGRIFVQHFESGGTFLSFDPHKVRDHFAREVQKAAANQAQGIPTDYDVEEDYGGRKP